MQINATITQPADYSVICQQITVICMLSLRCRLLQYAVFVGINGWYGNNIFLYIFCFIFQINLFFRYHVYFLRLQCIIKQLSDSVFLITLTSTLIIPHIRKTSSNNCLLNSTIIIINLKATLVFKPSNSIS